MLESKFQSDLIKEIEDKLDGAIVLKNDPNYIQGIPDLSVFYKGKWAALECKKNKSAGHQANQDWYVEHMNSMSFARFVFPENKEEVVDELLRFFTC